MREVPFSNGYLVQNLFKMEVEIRLDMDEPSAPKLLDCTKYEVQSNTRRKRSSGIPDEELLVKEPRGCLYEYEERPATDYIESEEEEFRWKSYLEQPTLQIHCENGYSESCLVRAYHASGFSVFWHLKYDRVLKAQKLEKSYVVHRVPRANFTVTKEILYRTDDLIELAKKGEMISFTYRCLPSGYLNRKFKIEKDPLVVELEENRGRLLLEYGGETEILTNYSKVVDVLVSKSLLTDRQVLLPNPPQDLKGMTRQKFVQLTAEIRGELDKLYGIEEQVEEEIRKIDNRFSLDRINNPISDLCLNWFQTKDRIIAAYKVRADQTRVPAPEEIVIDMNNQLALVCAQSSFVILWANAQTMVDRVEVDIIQKKILSLLKINYSHLYRDDHFRVATAVEKYKNLREYESFKATLVLMERKRLMAGMRISELNSEITRHKAAIKKRDDFMSVLSDRLQEIKNKLNLTEMALMENSKQVNELRARNTTIWSETKRRVEEALKEAGPIQRMPNPLWRFTKSFQYEIQTGENAPLEDKRFLSLNADLLAITENITTAVKISESLKLALSQSQDTISDLEDEKSKLAQANSKETNKLTTLRDQVKNLQSKLDEANQLLKSSEEANNRLKRDVSDLESRITLLVGDKLNKAEERYNAAELKFSNAEQRLSEAQQAFNEAKITLKSAETSLISSADSMNQTAISAEEKYVNATQALTQAKSVFASVHNHLNETAVQMAGLNANLSAHNQTVVSAMEKLALAEEKFQKAELRLHSAEANRLKAEQEKTVALNKVMLYEQAVKQNVSNSADYVEMTLLRSQLLNLTEQFDTLYHQINREKTVTKRDVLANYASNVASKCRSINTHLQTIVDAMNGESNKVRMDRMKRGTNWIWGLWEAVQTTGFGGSNWYINGERRALKAVVERQYEEFLNHSKLANAIELNYGAKLDVLKSNMEEVKAYAKVADENVKALKDNLLKVKDISVSNRVYLSFFSDLTTVQRLLIEYLQANTIRARLTESLTLLRNNILPVDLVNRTDLIRLLRDAEAYMETNMPQYKLAFNESKLEFYYKFPMANINLVNGARVIELGLPVLRKDNQLKMFTMKRIRTHPFYRWTNSSENEQKYELRLKHDLALYEQNGKFTMTAHSSQMECHSNLNNRLCLMLDSEGEKATSDVCLESIYKKHEDVKYCDLIQTTGPVPNLTLSTDTYYQTIRNKDNLVVGLTIHKDRGVIAEDTMLSFLSNKSQLDVVFKKFEFSSSDEYNRLTKEFEENLKPKLLQEQSDLAERSVEKLFKQYGLKTGRLEMGKMSIDILSWIPIILCLAILASQGNWYTVGVVTVHGNV